MAKRSIWRTNLSFCATLAAVLGAGCGGGNTGELSPPPPMPDFALSVSPSATTIAQGATSSGIQVSVQSLNEFSGSVQIVLSGIPPGISANPQSPFMVQSGSSATLLIGASAAAATGNTSILVQGASGNLSHSTSISLTVQSSVSAVVSRTTYSRTDSQAALDDPAGEPHHRHMAYVPGSRHLFVANRARNRVEVFSTQDGLRLGSVDVAGASSVDLAADGQSVWVGTVTEQIAAIDTARLQRTKTFQLTGLVPIPNTNFDRPEEVVALSGGKLLVRFRQANAAESLLALWDPINNSLTDLTPLAPQVFQNGVGVLARSGDHTRVLVASNDGSGNAIVLDGNGALLTDTKSIGAGALKYAAGNSDGSRFVEVLDNGNDEQLVLLDSSLNILSTSAISFVRGVAFSRDGQSLIVSVSENGIPLLSVLSAADLHSLGAVADSAIQGIRSEVEDVDEAAMVFGLSNRGISFVDASQLGTISAPAPTLSIVPAVTPSAGPNIGGTSVTFSGQNLRPNPALHFGGQTAAVSASSASQIQATSPASTANGAVNVNAYFPDGAIALAPDAFCYGVQILEILPNAGSSAGGDTVAIYGYGFGEDIGKISVKFGSASAPIQKLEDVQSLITSLGLDSTYPFPLQRLTVSAPAGSIGKISISINSPAGSAMASQAFQYLRPAQVFARAGFYKFILYDQKRQWVYLSNIDRLDVFDLSAGMFRSGILPPGGPPPNALIRQAALTPDASELLVADFGAQSIYLIDPDTAAGTGVNVGSVPGDANSGPVRIAATSAQTVFVGLAGYSGNNSPCSTCLQQMDLTASPVSVQTAPQADVSALISAPLVDASGDGSAAFFSFASAPGQPMAGWNAANSGQFLTAQTNIPTTDIASASDGTSFASQNSGVTEIRNANLELQSVTAESELEGIQQRTNVPGIALHPSGALVYVPFLTGPAPVAAPFTGLVGGVDILDAHTGRLRLRVMLPEPLAMLAADVDGLHGRFLAIDENGQRIFAITASGLTVVQLARVPLGIGSITPASGSLSGGANLTIRGSGFLNGATAVIGGKAVAVTFVDTNTLKFAAPTLSAGGQRLVITNPDGETVSLDAAFTAN